VKQFCIACCLFPLLFLGMAGSTVAAEPVIVVIQKMKFQPQEVTVKKGGLVRWENREIRQYHSVWFEQAGEPEPDYLFPEESYETKFDTVGDFPYRCGPHPEMTGVVHVIN
jgi:plastocyanin